LLCIPEMNFIYDFDTPKTLDKTSINSEFALFFVGGDLRLTSNDSGVIAVTPDLFALGWTRTRTTHPSFVSLKISGFTAIS
jgi:hypothetical protein